MRLRYLSLHDAPPLQQLAIPFVQAPVLDRACTIRFVIGVNGSGKSRLLQALTQVFLHVEQKLEQKPPLPFQVTLAYDLLLDEDDRTIYLQYQSDEPTQSPELVLVSLPRLKERVGRDWEQLLTTETFDETKIQRYQGGSATIDQFLPKALFVYTSGLTSSWKAIFTPSLSDVEPPKLGEVEERPINWQVADEQAFLRAQGEHSQADALHQVDLNTLQSKATKSRIGYFITPNQLKVAAAAATLFQAASDFETNQYRAPQPPPNATGRRQSESGLRYLLDEVGWAFPVTFGIRLNFQPDQWRPEDNAERIAELYNVATTVLREPEPSHERLLLFDLQESITQADTTQRRIDALLNVFRSDETSTATPYDMFTQLYRWQQAGVVVDIVLAIKKHDVADLILYDWLSDGEQLFVGRMALFHLLAGVEDAMMLLDEPETHFNDIWKRRIVDIIDDTLGETANEVLISTHSSIALTDVFREEITFLRVEDGQTVREDIRVLTFGADPSEIMVYVFGMPDGMGERALEYLDKQLDRKWTVADLDDLETIIRNIGGSYHRAELRAIWRRLSASQNQPAEN